MRNTTEEDPHMGKFSKPRNQFRDNFPQEPVNIPAPEEVPEAPVPQPVSIPVPEEVFEEPVPQADPDPIHEDEAIEEAFRQVSAENPVITFIRRNKRTLLIGVCSGLLALFMIMAVVLALGPATDPYDGKILENVTIAGIDVGGLTKSQAESVVRSVTDKTFPVQDMVVQFPDGQLRLSPETTGVRLNVKAAVKAAYEYGRTGSQAQQKAAYERAQTQGHTIVLLPYLDLDAAQIREAVEEYAASHTSAYAEPTWWLEGEVPDLTYEEGGKEPVPQTLMMTMGTPGISMDLDSICDSIIDAYSLNIFLVEDYAEGGPSAQPFTPDLQAIYDACYIAPVDASMDQQTYKEVPGSYGCDLDIAAAQELIDIASPGETVSIPLRLIAPGVDLESMLFQDILGYCESPHTNNENRNANLAMVCQYLNGLVLDPGEEFSYNESVGERTIERGFKPAPAYSGTKLVDSVGGGVCQGSSTLYYAALVADMEIVFRINHGFPVNYLPWGLDATVNWGGPDLQFKNSSNYPIMLKAEVSDGYMKMWIMGTEERDYYSKLDFEITRYIAPDEVVEEHGPDSGYYDGQVLQKGTTGYVVRSYRYRYDRETNELISKDFIALSTYMTEDKIVVKIVDDEKETEPTEPSETTEPTTEATEPSTQATTPTTEATEPSTEATDPPATDSPATDPPATDPPATDPPATDPPATDPPATDPPATDPPATDPPATDPPATDPPATDPPSEGGEG